MPTVDPADEAASSGPDHTRLGPELTAQADQLVQFLNQVNSEPLNQLLDKINTDPIHQLLDKLDSDPISRLLEQMSSGPISRLLEQMSSDPISRLLDQMSSDQRLSQLMDQINSEPFGGLLEGIVSQPLGQLLEQINSDPIAHWLEQMSSDPIISQLLDQIDPGPILSELLEQRDDGPCLEINPDRVSYPEHPSLNANADTSLGLVQDEDHRRVVTGVLVACIQLALMQGHTAQAIASSTGEAASSGVLLLQLIGAASHNPAIQGLLVLLTLAGIRTGRK